MLSSNTVHVLRDFFMSAYFHHFSQKCIGFILVRVISTILQQWGKMSNNFIKNQQHNGHVLRVSKGEYSSVGEQTLMLIHIVHDTESFSMLSV